MERKFETSIHSTPERVWQALTEPNETSQYWYGAFNRSGWTKGARWTSEAEDGHVYLEGEILAVEPPKIIQHTFHVVDEPDAAAEAPSKVTFTIKPIDEGCSISVLHEDLDKATYQYTEDGWETILEGLKNYLETEAPVAR